MHHMYGSWDSSWDPLWMSLMVVLWIVVLGAVVYGAVRIAVHHERSGDSAAQPPR
jgi:hypothetical protein